MTEEKAAPTLAQKLATPVNPKFVSTRKGLSYITARYTRSKLNQLFGFDKWDFRLQESYLLEKTDEAIRWYVHGRLVVNTESGMVVKDAVAIGHGVLVSRDGTPVSPSRASEVIDFAAAEAVSDALKRAAKDLGEALGLSLYPMTGK